MSDAAVIAVLSLVPSALVALAICIRLLWLRRGLARVQERYRRAADSAITGDALDREWREVQRLKAEACEQRRQP